MSTMIDRWNRIKVSAEGEAQSHPDELRASRCEGQAHAIKIAIDEFVDACTPRAPRAEWFGTGKGQWDSWWVHCKGGFQRVFYSCRVRWSGSNPLWLAVHSSTDLLWDEVDFVVPVAREGFPAPVSWKVVES